MIQRNEHAFLPPFDDIELQTRRPDHHRRHSQALTELLSSRPEFVEGVLRSAGPKDLPTRGERLALTEAVVSPGSRLIGRTVRQIGFRHAVGAHGPGRAAPLTHDPRQAGRNPS
jgi:hypothetical protein